MSQMSQFPPPHWRGGGGVQIEKNRSRAKFTTFNINHQPLAGHILSMRAIISPWAAIWEALLV